MPLAACDACDAIYVTEKPAPDAGECPGCAGPLRAAPREEAVRRAKAPRRRDPPVPRSRFAGQGLLGRLGGKKGPPGGMPGGPAKEDHRPASHGQPAPSSYPRRGPRVKPAAQEPAAGDDSSS